MQIIVYGPGCTRCHEAEAVVRRVVAELAPDVEVRKVEDIRAMVAAGVLSTPAIAVDGVMVMAGRVPRPEDVKAWVAG